MTKSHHVTNVLLFGCVLILWVCVLLLAFKNTEFSMKYSCNGVKGKVSHDIPNINNCQNKMYAVQHELAKACSKLTVEQSLCKDTFRTVIFPTEVNL